MEITLSGNISSKSKTGNPCQIVINPDSFMISWSDLDAEKKRLMALLKPYVSDFSVQNIDVIILYCRAIPCVTSLLKSLNLTETETSIDLSSKGTNDDIASTFGYWLQNNNTLSTLNFSGKQTRLDGKRSISEGLSSCLKINRLEGMEIRKYPKYPGQRIGIELKEGDVVAYGSKTICYYGKYPIAFYRLLDGRGWVHNFNPKQPESLNAVSEGRLRLVRFNPGKLGLRFRGRTISRVVPRGQAEKANIFVGSMIIEVNGTVPNSQKAIEEAVTKTYNEKKPTTILFWIDNQKNDHSKNRWNRPNATGLIGDIGVAALAKGLQLNATLTYLDLKHNKIKNNGALALSNLMKINTTIIVLNLLSNQIEGSAAEQLSASLMSNKTIQTFSEINLQTFKENKTGDRLDFNRYNKAKAGPVEACVLSALLKLNNSLKILELGWNNISNIGACALATSLKVNIVITSLNILGNVIGQSGAESLATSIVESKSINIFSGIPVNTLKKNKSESILDLGGYQKAKAGNAEAFVLGKLLKTNSTLLELLLGDNMIDDIGGQALAEGLKVNNTLKKLLLADNQISNVGAIALAQALEVNQTLVSLNLGTNKIKSAGAQAIGNVLKQRIPGTQVYEPINFIEKKTNIDVNDWVYAKKQDDLLTVTFESRTFGMQIRKNRVVYVFPGSQAAKMNVCVGMQIKAVNGIRQSSDMRSIQKAMLKTKNARKNTFVTFRQVNGKHFGKIEMLNINKSFRVCFSNGDLHLSCPPLDINACRFKRGKVQTADRESYSILFDDGTTKHGRTNYTLTELDLRSNFIKGIGAYTVGESLTNNNTMKKLILWKSQIFDDDAIVIARGLKTNTTLIELILHKNMIGDGGARSLAEALKINKTLTVLGLNENNIFDEGVGALSEALKVNTNLRCLWLSINRFGDGGARALGEGLKKNIGVTQLDISANRVTSSGATALAEGLKVNNILQSLDLHNNHVKDDGVDAITEALLENKTLQQLDLRGNDVRIQSKDELRRVQKQHVSLKDMDI